MKILAILLMLPAIIFTIVFTSYIFIELLLLFVAKIITSKELPELICGIIIVVMFIVGYNLLFGWSK